MDRKQITTFDAIVIGSGQAGIPLVFKLASEGQKVAFIEKEHFGGTCVNNGCTPTKAYVASARRMWEAQHGGDLGIEIPLGTKANLRAIKARKDKLVQNSVNGIAKGVENHENISFFKGEARFEGDKIVEVNHTFLTAKEIYINVGGSPFIPDGYEDIPYLTNQSILELEELPEHLLIIGGSYIGLEFGQMFSRLGSKVTIIERGKTIIGREDEETSQTIQRMMEEESALNNEEGDKLEKDLQQIRISSQSSLLQLEQRLQTATMEYDTLVQEASTHSTKLYDDTVNALDELIQFKLYIQTQLHDFEGAVARALD